MSRTDARIQKSDAHPCSRRRLRRTILAVPPFAIQMPEPTLLTFNPRCLLAILERLEQNRSFGISDST